ncbi:MAG: hypothetical protein HN790_15175 [Methylococcales bacterium]|nr:hypothetical protein [Methylococcales bacterium]
MMRKSCGALLMFAVVAGCDTTMDAADIKLDVTDIGFYAAAFNESGESVVVGTVNSEAAQMYELATGEQKHYWQHANMGDSGVVAADFSLDGKAVMTADINTLVKWDAASGKALGYWTFPVKVRAVALSPNGEQALIGFEDMSALYFDLKQSKPLFLMEHDDIITTVDLSDDGRYAVTGSDDETAKVWDLSNKGVLLHTFAFSNKVKSVALSSRGTYVMAASAHMPAKVWKVASGELVTEQGTNRSTVLSAKFSADESLLLLGYSSNRLLLNNTQTGAKLGGWYMDRKSRGTPSGAPVLAVGFAGKKAVVAAVANGYIVRFQF